MNQSDAYIKRIDELLVTNMSDANTYASIVAAHTGAVTLAVAIYGVGRPQVQLLLDAVKKAHRELGDTGWLYQLIVWPAVQGSLRAMKDDVQSGVISDIERRGRGAVLTDMLGLAKEALNDGREGTTNVAAVLVAASFEDTMRKMGEALAGVQGTPKLADVLTALKNADVLKGASVGTAQSYLQFRNHALHAEWAKVKPEEVVSCLGFVEQLLVQHFS